MLLEPLFDRFVKRSPFAVMSRAILERALCPRDGCVASEVPSPGCRDGQHWRIEQTQLPGTCMRRIGRGARSRAGGWRLANGGGQGHGRTRLISRRSGHPLQLLSSSST